MKQNNLFKVITITFVFLLSFSLSAQTVKGKVTDADGEGLAFMNVLEKGTKNGTTTDEKGEFSITVSKLPTTLVVKALGFKTTEKEITSASYVTIVVQDENVALDEVVLVGSRNKNRTVANTPVPVDIIDVSELTSIAPQTSVSSILNYVAPSFTSTSQTVSDGTDHLDPAALRGLGPDQVLVLLNGKRRHTSSLVNVNSTVGRGSVGTDMNAIPAFAISRIEVLKDGAAAQYGSDAIAGVINVVLKKDSGLDVQITSGANWGTETNNQDGGLDGESFQVDINYGTKLGDKGGFINFTGSASTRNPSFRAGKDGFTGSVFNAANSIEWVGLQSGLGSDITQYSLTDIQFLAQGVQHFDFTLKQNILNATSIGDLQSLLNFDTTDAELGVRGLTRQDFSMRIGQSELRNGQFFVNMELPVSDTYTLYAFGGLSNRDGNAAGFYRRPDQSRAFTGLYPAGFLPEINTDISDKSIAVGIRGQEAGWDIDLSNTYGVNAFDFTIANSVNATMLGDSPLTAYAGGFSFMQNTTNLDVSRFFEDYLNGVNIAFGAEYRVENYQIFAGQEESWATYDVNGNIWNGDPSLQVLDFFGRSRAGGIQVFPGFRPENERNKFRNNYAAYVDVEASITDAIDITGALRYENYSDFGTTLNWKLAGLFKLSDNVNFRAATSTGFRAPSLHQLNFNTISTNFVAGVPSEVGTYSNDSRQARAFGLTQLKQEESFSFSAGFTAKFPDANLTLTADAFFTAIDDRVVLTNNISPTPATQQLFDLAGVERVRFFDNVIDTETKGFDIVLSHKTNISDLRLLSDLAISYNKTQLVDEVRTPPGVDPNDYFTERDVYFIEFASPRVKGNLSHSLVSDKWSVFLRNSLFGSVFNPDILNGEHPEFGAKVVTDLTFSYDLMDNLTLTVGSNNIFDVYPDATPTSLTSGNNFIYPRTTSQFGINGRTMFARLNFKL